MLFSVIFGTLIGLGLYLYKRKVDKESEAILEEIDTDLDSSFLAQYKAKLESEQKTFEVWLLGNDSFKITGHPDDILKRQFFKDPASNKLYNTNQVKYLKELNG